MKKISRLPSLTRGCNSVLPGGLVFTQSEQHCLDGANEDPSQAAVEYNIEERNFDCGGEGKKRVSAQRKLKLLRTWRKWCELLLTGINILEVVQMICYMIFRLIIWTVQL